MPPNPPTCVRQTSASAPLIAAEAVKSSRRAPLGARASRPPLGARASRPSPPSAGGGRPSPRSQCVASRHALIHRTRGRAGRPRSQDFSPTLLITAGRRLPRVVGLAGALPCSGCAYRGTSSRVAHHGDRGIRVGDGRRPACVVDHVQDAARTGVGKEDREQIVEA